MLTVHKYKINTHCSEVYLPIGAEILKVAEQNNELYIWVLISTESYNDEIRTFHAYGTAQELLEYTYEFIDTVLMKDGLVWHVFEVTGY